jgi:hypothetical protein
VPFFCGEPAYILEWAESFQELNVKMPKASTGCIAKSFGIHGQHAEGMTFNFITILKKIRIFFKIN